MDTKVLTVQKWLNSTYQKKQGWKNVAEDGYTGGGTVAGLEREKRTLWVRKSRCVLK